MQIWQVVLFRLFSTFEFSVLEEKPRQQQTSNRKIKVARKYPLMLDAHPEIEEGEHWEHWQSETLAWPKQDNRVHFTTNPTIFKEKNKTKVGAKLILSLKTIRLHGGPSPNLSKPTLRLEIPLGKGWWWPQNVAGYVDPCGSSTYFSVSVQFWVCGSSEGYWTELNWTELEKEVEARLLDPHPRLTHFVWKSDCSKLTFIKISPRMASVLRKVIHKRIASEKTNSETLHQKVKSKLFSFFHAAKCLQYCQKWHFQEKSKMAAKIMSPTFWPPEVQHDYMNDAWKFGWHWNISSWVVNGAILAAIWTCQSGHVNTNPEMFIKKQTQIGLSVPFTKSKMAATSCDPGQTAVHFEGHWWAFNMSHKEWVTPPPFPLATWVEHQAVGFAQLAGKWSAMTTGHF